MFKDQLATPLAIHYDREENKYFNNCWRILDATLPDYRNRIAARRNAYLANPTAEEARHNSRLQANHSRFNDLLHGRPELSRTIIESHEDHLSAMGRIAKEVGALKARQPKPVTDLVMVPEKLKIGYEPIRVEPMPRPDAAGRNYVWLGPRETYFTLPHTDTELPQPDGRRIHFGLAFMLAGKEFENPIVISSDAGQNEQQIILASRHAEYPIDNAINFSHVLDAAEEAAGGQIPLF